jgi:hypothetical protein
LRCKCAVIRKLRNKLEKHGKNIKKRLANVNKGSTFAPATAKAFIEILAGIWNLKKRNF